MYFLKLTRVPDGATVYLSPYAIAAMTRNEPTAAKPVHTSVLLVGGRVVDVLEHPDVIVERERTFCFTGMGSPPVPPARGEGEPAPAPPPASDR